MRFLLCALLLFLLPACGGETAVDGPEDPAFEEGIPTEVRITLSTRSGNGTRADRDGEDKDPTSSIELIHDDWWIVFVNKNKLVSEDGKDVPDIKIFTRDDVTEKVTSTPSSVKDPKKGFEAETFKIIIPSGEYRIYAFANVPRKTKAEFEKFLKYNDDEGKKRWEHTTKHLIDLIGPDKFKDPDNPANDGMQWPDTENIPMTGVMTNKVIKNTVEEAFNIEVVRAVAKVEFAFSKQSADNFIVKELEFGPITKNEKISFVPNYSAIGKGPNNKLFEDVNGENATTLNDKENGTMTFKDLSLTDDPLEKYNVGLFSFYCKESMPAKDGGPFTIKLTVKKNEEEPTTRTLYTDKITYINRNNWIRIPIEFSDWKIYWKLRAYPPIGGYPPVFDQNEDGTSMSARMGTGGEFAIYPYLIKKGENIWTDKIDWNPKKADGTIDKDRQVKASVVEDAKGIFMKDSKGEYLLSVDFENKSIVGELDPKKTGTAKVQIDFYLEASTGVGEVRTCTFTINRNNGTNGK